jgi:hypothetical protein
MTPVRVALLFVAAAAPLSGCVSLPTRQELAAAPGPQVAMPVGGVKIDGRARFRDIFCSVLEREPGYGGRDRDCSEYLWRLADEVPAESRPPPDPDRSLQFYLVTGAFSECLGDEARPFNNAVAALTESGYRIETIVVSGRSGSEYNARQIAERLANRPQAAQGPIVLIGYSKGANDILEFLVRYPDIATDVQSAVSVAGAIAGSPLADQADEFYELVLGWVPLGTCPQGDGKVIESLRGQARKDWLQRNSLPGFVQYFSIGAFTTRSHMSAALVPVWKQLLRYDHRNDGQVLARDSLIPGSTLLGYVDADHWSAVIDVESVHPVLGARRDPTPFPRAALLEAILLQVAESRAHDATQATRPPDT